MGYTARIQKVLRRMKFGFITSKNGEFVTSSFQVLNGIDEVTEENEEMTYFPLHPHIAVLYGNSMPRKAWNRVTPMAGEDIDFTGFFIKNILKIFDFVLFLRPVAM